MGWDAIRSVENTVLMAFNGTVPEGLVLRTDNGPQYISKEFRSAMKLLGIKLEIYRNTLRKIMETLSRSINQSRQITYGEASSGRIS